MQDDRGKVGGPARAPAQFAELVRQHYVPALRYATRWLHDAVEAEDCVQEAFAEVFLHLASLRDEEAASGWVRSIVRHRCLRRSRRRDLELLPLANGVDELPRSEVEGSEDRLQRAALVQLLVRSLPAHEREIVLLFYGKECSQREISSFLGIPISTVNNRLYDARERMRHWENNMESHRIDVVDAPRDRVSRVGTIVSCRGPLIEARFEPNAPFDIFDALAVVAQDGQCVECMKVAHCAGDGRLVCLSTSQDGARPDVGTTVLNTGKVGIGLTRLAGARGVSAPDLCAAAVALRGEDTRAVLPTGIKAIDLLCPFPARGAVAQSATGGVGRMVLLDEIAHRCARADIALKFLCLADRSDPDPLRGSDETVLWGQSGGIGYYWALSDQGTDPECEALDACDAAIYMSPLLAVHGWYPAIDPEHSRSRLLTPELVGKEHCILAERARRELVFLKRAHSDPVTLELLASRAHVAAQRRARASAPHVQVDDSARLARALRLQLFLTQPFGVVSEWTEWASVDVSIDATLAGCRAILDGEVDDVPAEAFAYAGTLDDVRRHARDGIQRRYGK